MKKRLLPFVVCTVCLTAVLMGIKITADYRFYAKRPRHLDTNQSCVWEWVNIPQMLEYADVVAVVTMAEKTEEPPSRTGIFEVEEVLWGECPYKEIVLADESVKPYVETGGRYIFILNERPSHYHGENAYSIAVNEGVYTYRHGRIKGLSKENDRFINKDNNTMRKMRKYLASVPTEFDSDGGQLCCVFLSARDIFKESSNVLKVRITHVEKENELTYVAFIQNCAVYKGQRLDETVGYRWPSYEKIKKGEEYYVFLDEENRLISKYTSIVSKDEKMWQECTDFLAGKEK